MAALQSLLRGPSEGGTVGAPLSAMYQEWNCAVGLAQLGCDSGRGGTQSCHLEPGAGFFGKIRFWDPYIGNGTRPGTTGKRNLSTPNTPQRPG